MKNRILCLANNPLSALWMASEVIDSGAPAVFVFTGLDPETDALMNLRWIVDGASGDHIGDRVRASLIEVMESELLKVCNVSLEESTLSQRESAYFSWIKRQKYALSENENSVRRLAEVCGASFFSFYEPFYEGSIMVRFRNFKSICSERRRKINILHQIKDFFKASKLNREDFKTLFFANGNIQYYFAHLIPAAQLFRFEHGIGDLMRNTENKADASLWESIKKRFKDFLIHFDSSTPRFDKAFSILSVAQTYCTEFSIRRINARTVSFISEKYCSKIELKKYAGKTIGVFLVNTGGHLGGELWSEADFSRELIAKLGEAIRKEELSIDHWLVKTRFETGLLSEPYVLALRKEFPEVEVSSFKEIAGENLNLELYLSSLKPKVLVGCASSSLFYLKSLSAESITISYHQFFQDYCQNKFNKYEIDVEWIKQDLIDRRPPLINEKIDIVI